jgi:predicted nucleic acid-binding protein
MITSIDSSVLWMVFNDEPGAEAWSRKLIEASRQGELVLCDVVLAEIAPAFDSAEYGLDTLEGLGIRFDPISPNTAFEAGQLFKRYRQEGGPRRNLIPDFLIGAHALHQCNRLAAVDRGYLRRYFPTLNLLSP